MAECPLGRVLFIINPASQNGKGVEAGAVAIAYMEELLHQECVTVETTNGPKHASDIAAEACEFDTVVALGGDGIVHETVQGLMRIPRENRPTFGLIPVGSGNDFAKSLDISKDVPHAVKQLVEAKRTPIDIGRCNDGYFAETLSFGLDAAIARDTMERRKRTGRTGTIMYLEAGLYQLTHHLDIYPYHVRYDDGPMEAGICYLYAIQNGPSYGGGFDICPGAVMTDGFFDIAYAMPPLKTWKAALIFMMAKDGHHTKFKNMRFAKARKISIEFDNPVPVHERFDAVQRDQRVGFVPVCDAGPVPREGLQGVGPRDHLLPSRAPHRPGRAALHGIRPSGPHPPVVDVGRCGIRRLAV